MTILIARRARLVVYYNNTNISDDLQPHILSWFYTDNLSGEADDIQINLEDKEQQWIGPWMPEKGAVLKATIIRQNWEWQDLKIDQLSLGQFEIDEIEGGYQPSVVTIKGISVPESSSLRGEGKNRAWEKTKLSVIGRDIASKAKLKFIYEVNDDPEYDRIEQTGESDLSFLMRLCNDAGLCLKVTGTQLVILDEEDYEKKSPFITIKRGEAYLKSYQFRTTLSGLYKSCRVEYHDPKKKNTIKYEFIPPKPPNTGRVLVVNERVSSYKEAQRLAKKRLRQENKNQTTMSFVLLGDLRFVAGLTVNVAGFGKLDGKYIITKVIHVQQNGYETTIECRKCLEGY